MNKYIISIFLLVCTAQMGFSTTYYISSITGSSDYDGLSHQVSSTTGPFKYIESALALLKSGDTIELMAGEYHEKIRISSKNDITIKVFGDGDVYLYGTYEEYEDNERYSWTFVKEIKSTKFNRKQQLFVSQLPHNGRENNKSLPDYYSTFNYIFTGDGEQLYGYRSKEKFEERSLKATNGEGYYFTKDKLYVAVNNPNDSKFEKLFVTKSGFTIRLGSCKNFVLDGGENNLLHIKYGGRYGIFAEGDMSGLTITNIDFEYNSLAVYFFGTRGNELIIENCLFYYDMNSKWIWEDVKASLFESSGIAYADGDIEKLIIRNNIFQGLFNGIAVLPGHSEIYENQFLDISDDAIELDGPAVNTICHHNYFSDCFVTFSLCPVEKGPVYIYDNIIHSNRKSFSFQLLTDGSIRKVAPRTIKFWNLPNGKILKDGKKQFVSGNVHFYYNTVIARSEPLSIGMYGSKYISPVNSTFYNNIFYSEGTLTNSTGFEADGIDIDNNLFYSSFKDKREPRLFIGWNGVNHSKSLKNSSKWTDNVLMKIEFDDLEKAEEYGDYKMCNKSKSQILSRVFVKKLPLEYPGANELNLRELPGAQKK